MNSLQRPFAPLHLMAAAGLLLLLMLIASLWFATHSGQTLGVRLSPTIEGLQVTTLVADQNADRLTVGDRLSAIATADGWLVLQSEDLREEPDQLHLYSDYRDFFTRQQQLHQLLNQQRLQVRLSDGRELELVTAPVRSLNSLPSLFWLQLSCGALIAAAGFGVWAFQQRQPAALYYALSSFGLLLAILPAAIYSTRELALAGDLFYQLSLLNHFGSYLFYGAFLALIWCYPQPLSQSGWAVGFVLLALLQWLCDWQQLCPSIDAGIRYAHFVTLLLGAVLALLQWRRSEGDPLARAGLRWLLFSCFSGGLAYLVLVQLPLALGEEALLKQSIAWLIPLLVYLSVALGILRYRLFNLERWVFSAWIWFLSGLALLLFDLILVHYLRMAGSLALITALALVGWLYFPLRQKLWSQFATHNYIIDYERLLPEVMEDILAPGKVLDYPGRWQALLLRIFNPLEMRALESHFDKSHLADQGLRLRVPALAGGEPLELFCAERGSRLFHPADVRLVQAIWLLFERGHDFRFAFDRGVKNERQRIARDLHDEVGAGLLSLVYRAESEQNRHLARSILQELRTVIQGLENSSYSLNSALLQCGDDAQERCAAVSVELNWQQPNLPELNLTAREYMNQRRLLREAVSNVLRHAQANQLRVELALDGAELITRVIDNGVGWPADGPRRGRGMRNMVARAEELGGSIHWAAAPERGCEVEWRIPLRDAAK